MAHSHRPIILPRILDELAAFWLLALYFPGTKGEKLIKLVQPAVALQLSWSISLQQHLSVDFLIRLMTRELNQHAGLHKLVDLHGLQWQLTNQHHTHTIDLFWRFFDRNNQHMILHFGEMAKLRKIFQLDEHNEDIPYDQQNRPDPTATQNGGHDLSQRQDHFAGNR